MGEAARSDGDLAVKVGLESLLEEYEAALSSPVRLEVLGGSRKGERERLEAYLNALPYVPIEEADWLMAGRQAWALRDRSLSVPWNDILIATLSLRLRCRVYAVDSPFDAMSKVIGIRLYVPGPGGRFVSDPSWGPLADAGVLGRVFEPRSFTRPRG